jgi:hypothetical protein
LRATCRGRLGCERFSQDKRDWILALCDQNVDTQFMRTNQEPLVVYKPMTECTIEDLLAFSRRSDNLAKRAHAELARRQRAKGAGELDT